VDLVIARSEGIVAIDNQPLAVDTSPLASNIALVAYDCTAGKGSIEYNDRLRLLEPFIDMTPYAPFVNAWLTQAALVTDTPLTLPLAKTIKLSLVDGIFNSKRQLPITALGRTWDASDQALMGMQAAIVSWDVAGAAFAADATLVNDFNNIGIATTRIANASANAAFSADSAPFTYIDSFSPPPNQTPHSGAIAFMTAVAGGGITGNAAFSANYGRPLSAITTQGPSISWPPLNSTVSVTLAMSDMRSLISSINSRRTTLQNTRLTKQNAINALSTIAAVIAYDVTTGWPS
jgi:hypothetical protein